MGLLSFIQDMADKGRDSTLVWQMFQADERFARIAKLNFEKSLLAKGITIGPADLAYARIRGNEDRRLTIGQFINEYYKK